MIPVLTRGAWTWTAGLAVDGDGSPHCYSPAGSGLPELDYLANAGSPGDWYGLACNASGVPYVQGSGDPAPGYYVSQTALVDSSRAVWDPRRYADAESVPYLVAPRDLRNRGVKLGDVAWVTYSGASSAAVIADVGPHYGEGSIALAQALGIPSSPKNGGVPSGVTCVVFPGSAAGWPRTVADFSAQAARLYADWTAAAQVA